jgi:hypothetical protein
MEHVHTTIKLGQDVQVCINKTCTKIMYKKCVCTGEKISLVFLV